MSRLATMDANLAELLNAPRIECEKKSCENCKYHELESGDESVGMDGYLYCNHPEIGMNSDDDGEGYVMLMEYVLTQEQENEFEKTCHEVVAEVCPHYSPVQVGQCVMCGKSLNAPEHTWDLWGDSFCDWVGIYSIPVCSDQCAETANQKAKTDIEAYNKSLLELDEHQSQVFEEDCYIITLEEEHLADLAFDTAREKRYGRKISKY